MKKVFISIFIVMTILLSMTMCYAYSDIDNSKYKIAIDKLSENGVINGYEDGTYKPEKAVTRAEMAKLLITSKEIDVSNINIEKSSFTDVSLNHWALKYIEKAKQEGIIKGDGNGKFRPDDTVSYQEAVTMIIRNSGYGILVDGTGTWPDNYISKAKELELFDNIDNLNYKEVANRGSIAQIVFNGEKIKTRNDYELVYILNEVLSGKIYSKEILENSEYNAVKGDITFKLNNLKVDGVTDEFKNKIINIANNSKINLDMGFDLKESYLQTNLNYLFKNESLLDTDIVLDRDSIYVFIKNIFNKYLKDDMDINIFNEPEEITVTEEDLIILNNLLKKINITKEKANITINKESISSNKTTIGIDNLSLLLNKIELERLEEIAKNDEKIKEEYKYISSYYSIEQLRKRVNEDIQDLKKEIEDANTDDYKTSVIGNIYTNPNGEIIGINIDIKEVENGEVNTSIVADILANKDYAKFDFKVLLDENRVSIKCESIGEMNNVTKCNIVLVEDNVELINADVNFNLNAYKKEIKIINKNDVVTELTEEEQKKLEEKVLFIAEKWNIKNEIQALSNKSIENSKRAVFYSDVSTIQGSVAMYKLNYYVENECEIPTIANTKGTSIKVNETEYFPFVSSITAETLNISGITLDNWYVSEDGVIIYKTGVKLENGDVQYNSNQIINNGEKVYTTPVSIKDYKA